jgi:predicted TIM-barrel fold metal-dependent hydrolase
MRDPVFRRNVALLGELGLLFELQVFPSQMAAAAEVAAEAPGTTFVLVHAGMLESASPEHVEPWREGLALLAGLPNVAVKLSGQGTFVHRVDEPLVRLVTRSVIDLFGPQRSMFGSNFPIESLWTDYAGLLGMWRRVIAALERPAAHQVLAATARRVNSLPVGAA